ncbi:cytosolic carboxypeptidase 1-like [Neocloeon triangulifer]|uniref:cytosolic carboxypeptidase 1-like n=1 Tax=Neocloeon triangulifer TaxID=2078957 RepID=UPI00286F28AF|nr:cytosolic carboxypeptidase 1-like [Neocloeon triangulifer]
MSDEDCVLDRLITLAEKPSENVPSLRATLARLHSRVASHDTSIRAKLVEKFCRPSSGYLALLLSLLDGVKDHPSLCSVVGILHECCAPKSAGSDKGGKKSSSNARVVATEQLVQLGGTHAILKLVIHVVKDSSSNQQQSSTPAWPHQFTHDLLWLLAHLAQRDGKFALKCRTMGALKTLHILLKNYVSSSKLLYPLLMMMKYLARNGITSKLLIKDGVAQTLEVTLTSLGLTPHPRLRLCIEVMNHLAKNPIFCGKLARTQVIHILLRLIERCDHQEGKLQIRIISSVLSTLYKMCAYKAGRVVFRSHNGLQIMHSFCTSCPDEKNRDALVGRASEVISVCLENRAPLLAENTMSPAKFPLPVPLTQIYCQDDRSGSSSRDTTPNSDEDKIGEEDCLLAEDIIDESCIEDNNVLPQILLRDLDDLKSYSNFFEEQVGSPRSSRGSSLLDSDDEEDTSSASKSTKSSMLSEYRALNPTETLKHLRILSKIRSGTDPFKVYFSIASKVISVIPFVKVAYPDMVGAESVNVPEPLYTKDRRVCRSKLMQCIEKGLRPEQGMSRVVYDVDSLVNSARRNSYSSERMLSNWDESRLGKENSDVNHLMFESRFESGNLRRATQVGALEYDLILMPDVNSSKHHQWFYFEVSNMKADLPYTFNIVNCEKQNSQFNYGMKPLLFSVFDAINDQIGWVRAGSDICYYRNTYLNQTAGGKVKPYLTTSFTITFPHSRDVCYMAYHYPYPYSRMIMQLWNWAHTIQPSIVFKVQQLCYSLNDNEVPLLTITNPDSVSSPIQDREIVILTARVHPGESNASWVMEGTLQYLLSNEEQADRLRENFVFKVIPMLNPEGVINGCHRCGLTDEDLNRRWSRPDPTLHPVIFNAKGLIEYCCRVLQRIPYFYCDLHGHSRRKNVFFYGCSHAGSWNAADRTVPEDPTEFLLLPHILQQTAPAFALNHCNFRVERARESTARVALWRQLGITRSYTLESSYCGCDQGPYQGYHLGTAHLHEMGRNLCEALGTLFDDGWKLKLVLACSSPQSFANEQPHRVVGGIAGLGGVRTAEEDLTNPSDESDYEEEYHAVNEGH